MTTVLVHNISPPPPPRDPAVARGTIADWNARAERFDSEDLKSLLTYLDTHADARALVEAVVSGSPYLRGLIQRHPRFVEDCFEASPEASLERLLADTRSTAAEADSEAGLMTALRLTKAKSALLIALADVAGAWPVSETTSALTRFADEALNAAVDWLLRDAARHRGVEAGAPLEASGIVVIAMGKYGARARIASRAIATRETARRDRRAPPVLTLRHCVGSR